MRELCTSGCTGVANPRHKWKGCGRERRGWRKLDGGGGCFCCCCATGTTQTLAVIYLVQRPPPCSRPTLWYSVGEARQYEMEEHGWRGMKPGAAVVGQGEYGKWRRDRRLRGVSQPSWSGPRASSVSSRGVEKLLAACLLPSFAIVSFLSVLVPLQFRLIDMYTYNIKYFKHTHVHI